jgi:hypothetical protein
MWLFGDFHGSVSVEYLEAARGTTSPHIAGVRVDE